MSCPTGSTASVTTASSPMPTGPPISYWPGSSSAYQTQLPRAPTAIAQTVVTKTKSGIFVLAAAGVWSSSRPSNPAASRDCGPVQQSASTAHDQHAPVAIPHCRASSWPISHRRRLPSRPGHLYTHGPHWLPGPSRSPLLMDLNVAAAQRPPLWWSIDDNGEGIVGARLAVIRHMHREGAGRSVVRAGPPKGGHVARDRERGEQHAVHLGAAGVVHVLQIAVDRPIGRLALHDEAEAGEAPTDSNGPPAGDLAHGGGWWQHD